MGTINIGRVIIGGIVAGIVGNILGFLADGVIFAPQWAAGMKALGRGEFALSQNLTFSFIGLVQGIFVVWLCKLTDAILVSKVETKIETT